jgi:hypothetical protein
MDKQSPNRIEFIQHLIQNIEADKKELLLGGIEAVNKKRTSISLPSNWIEPKK